MRSTAARGRQFPLSVTLPEDLRRRLEAQAKRRGLKVATAARTFIAERLNAIDDELELERAERWQRREALRTWERITRTGDRREVSKKQIDRDFAAARRRLAARERRSA